jgi:hypothetical protein
LAMGRITSPRKGASQMGVHRFGLRLGLPLPDDVGFLEIGLRRRGAKRFAVAAVFQWRRAKLWLELVPADARQRLSCGAGSKAAGVRVAADANQLAEAESSTTWLLFRRSLADGTDVAFFACDAQPETTFERLVQGAGSWTSTVGDQEWSRRSPAVCSAAICGNPNQKTLVGAGSRTL